MPQRGVEEQAEYWLEKAEADVMGVGARICGGENGMAAVGGGGGGAFGRRYTARLLKQAPEVYHTQINDLLLAALALALQQWRGAEAAAEETVG